MKKLFIQLYTYFSVHKIAYWLTLSVLVVFCAVSASRIHFEEDISKILNLTEETKEYNRVVLNSRSTSKIILRIYPANDEGHQEELTAIADSMAATLQRNAGSLLSNVQSGIDTDNFANVYETVSRNFPVFIESTGLTHYLDSALTTQNLHQNLQSKLRLLYTPGSVVLRSGFAYDPLGFGSTFFAHLNAFKSQAAFELIDNHLFTKDGKNVIVVLYPSENSTETLKNKELVNIIDAAIAQMANSELGKNYRYQYFGAVPVAVSNATQVQKDTMLTMGVVVVVLLILIIGIFRKKRIPALIFVTVGFGLLFSLAMVSLIEDSISLIAVGTGAVILGVVINYPIHFFTHYIHSKDIKQTIEDMVVPMTVGSLTTIGGFFCLLFTRSELLHDMGLFGGFCLVGAALFSLIFLPHLAGQVKEDKDNSIRRFFERISRYSLDKSRIAVGFIILVTPILFYFSFGVKFDNDLYAFNYMTPELKEAEKEMLALSGEHNNIYVISKGKTIEETLENAYKESLWVDSLRELGYECSITSVSSFVPPRSVQQQRATDWNNYWTDPNHAQKKQDIKQAFEENGLNADAFEHFFGLLAGNATPLTNEDYEYLINTFSLEVLFESDSICTLISQVSATQGNKAEVIAELNKSPHAIVLDKSALAKQFGNAISSDFDLITIITSLLVFFALYFAYGRLELALIAFIPMVISWVWILGLMAIFGIKFNIINIILSTFIFGLGDDFCIFTLDSNLNEYIYRKQHAATVRMSVIISGLTSLIGLGVLFLAKHPALYSLATISVLGIFSVLFISQTLTPLLFRWLISSPTSKGFAPISLVTLAISVLTFGMFGIMSIVMGIVSFILWPFGFLRKYREKVSHYITSLAMKFIIYGLGFPLQKTVANESNEQFKKPAIIICNHQSILDILFLLLLNPRITLMTKSWVWNSPIMGLYVRLTGFLRAEDGVEENVDAFRKKLDEGYSIAIFPEGSRSEFGKINRFHKGAFYLAEKLHADIIPMLTQHSWETLPKGSWLVRPLQMDLKIYPRIAPEDTTFGTTYSERCKAMNKWYRTELEKFTAETQDNRYYMRKLKDGFMFKGAIVENYLRVKVRLENYYDYFDSIVPKEGKIADVGCGYGFMSYMLWMKSPKRQITAYDYDEEKVEIGRYCYFNRGNVKFVAADALQVDFEPTDCFIVSDMLHYLPFDSQLRLISNMVATLNEGGAIMIRDADKDNAKRTRFNKCIEFVSTRVVSFNKVEGALEFVSFNKLIDYAKSIGLSAEIVDNNHLATNKLLILRKRL